MPETSNKLTRFWQELKRRKVFGVVTTYAAAAYIIIEVTNNLAIPLHLPDWFASLEFIILLIGLPVVIILSWIFDFTPKGIKKTESVEESEIKEVTGKTAKRRLRPSYVLNAVLIIAVIVLAYPKIFKQDRLEKLRSSGERISVAVMPFRNMTNDTTWNIWQTGIQSIFGNYLSNSPEELKVRQAETVNDLIQGEKLTNYASITPSIASKISQKLDADILIYGSIKQAGPKLRLDAQLIDSRTQETLRAFEIDGPAEEKSIFQIIDSLKLMVKNFLIVSKLTEEIPSGLRITGSISDSPEALRYFMYGSKAFTSRDYSSARDWYLKALSIDSNLITAAVYSAVSYANQGMYEEGEKWCNRAYEKIEVVPLNQKLLIKWLHASYFETPYEEIKYVKQILELDDQRSLPYYILGVKYNELQQYDKAIPEFKKALKLHEKWGLKPVWAYYYEQFGFAYHETAQYRKEKNLYKKGEQDFPDNDLIIRRQAILSLSQGDEKGAKRYIDKYISVRKEYSASEATIATNLAFVYEESNLPDKAEKYYREALVSEPEDPYRLNALAWFLIDKDRNVKEGLELIDKALKISPDDYLIIDTKGWGLFKQGKNKEALELLEKAWALKPVYDHEVYLHLEAAKKEAAGQKKN